MKICLFLFSICFLLTVVGQDSYDRARQYFDANQIDSARFYINRYLDRSPSIKGYFLSGMIHEAEGKALRALVDYEAVIRNDPKHLEAYFQKGLIYYNIASYAQAIKDFSMVIRQYSSSETHVVYFVNDPFGSKSTFITTLQSILGRVYQYRGLTHEKLGDMDSALSDFNQSFAFDTLADYYINRSQLHAGMGQEDLAIDDLKAAIKLEEDNYLAWYNLALLDNDTELPVELLEDDTFTPMLNLLGAHAYENKNYPLAVSYLTKAIEANNKDELAYLNRGKAFLKTGMYPQARADFLEVLQINPNALEVFFLIGNAYFYEKNYEDAIGFYERYLASDRGYKNVWYNAAMAYLSLQKTDRACECLRQSHGLGMDRAESLLDKYCQSQ